MRGTRRSAAGKALCEIRYNGLESTHQTWPAISSEEGSRRFLNVQAGPRRDGALFKSATQKKSPGAILTTCAWRCPYSRGPIRTRVQGRVRGMISQAPGFSREY